jgi:hypothetical protein
MKKIAAVAAAFIAALAFGVALHPQGWTWDEDSPAAHYIAGGHEGSDF